MNKKNLLILAVAACLGSSAFAGQGVLFYKAGFPQVAKPLLINELQTEPQSKAQTSFYLGNIYFGENKPDSAELYFKSGLAADPTYANNAIGMVMLNMKKDIKTSEAEIKKILKVKKNKKDLEVYLNIGYAYLYNGMDEKAKVYQKKAKDLKAKNPAGVYVLMGDILAKDNLGDACINYEQAIMFDENNKEAYIKYARAYRVVNSKLAIEKLLVLKQKDPSFTLVDRELGDVYYISNDFEKAAKYYETYLQSGNSDIQDLTKYSMTLFLNHDFQKSLEVANIGLQKAPKSPAFNRLAMYNNVDLKQNAEALKAADLFFNKSENPEFTYLDYRYYGQALRDAKQVALATEQYKKALTYDATKVELWKDISDMYNENNDYASSINAYNNYLNSLADNKKTADVIIALGKLYYSLGNDSTAAPEVKKSSLLKADSIFTQIAAMEPANYRGDFWRARTNSALDPETTLGLAKPYYEKTAALIESKEDAARYNSVLTECYSYLGYYTLLQKDNAKSIEYWNKILKINPNNATAKKAIEGIANPKKGKK